MKNKEHFVSSVRVSCLCINKENHARPARRNKNLIRFLGFFVVLAIIAVSMPFSSFLGIDKVDGYTPPVVLAQQQNIDTQTIDQKVDQKSQVLKDEAEAIDAYFKKRNMPLYGMGMKFAEEADKNDLDWRLLPAIAVRESTGGKHDCVKVENNPFGWGGCKIAFDSEEQAIETLALNLGGNNPNTEHHYSGKTTKEILQKYNPPSVIPHYAQQVISIMDAIGDEDMSPTSVATTNT
jgi:hypothetical protein